MKDTKIENAVSQDFLEKALQRKIESFRVTNGTNAGDNYCSTMYSIEVHFASNQLQHEDGNHSNEHSVNNGNVGHEVVHLISKCYPKSALRQEMHIAMNAFHKELSFYTVFVPELLKMQEDMNLKEIIPPTFASVVAGHAINFDEEEVEPGKVYKPFDNYIMMVDLRKPLGYRLFDRFKSYDPAHVSLVVGAMAKNHALSWIYKQKNNIQDITTKFPFIKNDFSVKYMEDMFVKLMTDNGAIVYETVKKALGESSPAVQGTKRFLDAAAKMFKISYDVGSTHHEYAKIMRIKPEKLEENNKDDIPWKVVTQGDVWTNNMLFRYNEETGEPVDVIPVDLQLIREACPTADLAYMLYASTDADFRKAHMEDMLELYAEKFTFYCRLMKTHPLPRFSASELKRRFHLSKPFGFCLVLLGLPIFLLKESEISDEDLDPDEDEEEKDMADMISSICSGTTDENNGLTDRAVGVVMDMYHDGII